MQHEAERTVCAGGPKEGLCRRPGQRQARLPGRGLRQASFIEKWGRVGTQHALSVERARGRQEAAHSGAACAAAKPYTLNRAPQAAWSWSVWWVTRKLVSMCTVWRKLKGELICSLFSAICSSA